MALTDFSAITQSENDTTSGLVWSGEVQEGKYFAELQTGIIPQLVHLIIFDMENGYVPVYEALTAFATGASLDEEAMVTLNGAVETGLEALNSP